MSWKKMEDFTKCLICCSLIGVDSNALAEGDGIRVSKQASRFVYVTSSMDSSSQKANESPTLDEITKLFGVPLKNPKDIDDFMRDIELSKYELCNSSSQAGKTSAPTHESVQSVDINTKSTSYTGVAVASTKEQPKVNSNFRPLVTDPVFNGVNIFIPRKVVKK
nr:hypothetical protein [Tanacetum cinerariifolium]